MSSKTTKKRVTKVPEGITYKRTKSGINVTISENGRIIAVLRGYNNTQNMSKGLHALYDALREAWVNGPDGKFLVTDLTSKKAPAKRK